MHQSSRSAGGLALQGLGVVGLVLLAAVAACGDGDSSGEPSQDAGAVTPNDSGTNPNPNDAGIAPNDSGVIPEPTTYTIGGTVTGLAPSTGDAGLADAGQGALVLQNGSEKITVSKNGAFAFTTKGTSGAGFEVVVSAQPDNPVQTCTVSGGKGTIATGNVTSVTVNCDTKKLTIGGHVTGLVGGGLKLRVNDTEDVSIAVVDGTYAFPSSLASGATYSVTVKANPTNRWQNCTLVNATGQVDDTNVTNIDVTCVDQTFTVSGTLTGVTTADLVMKNTYSGGGGPETINPAANAPTFAFVQPVRSGETFAVSTSGPYHCDITGGAATMAGANVTDVAVACTPSTFDYAFTGAPQSFVVPAWATSLDVVLEGAQGGSDFAGSVNYGGKVTATVAVTPGETLSLYVGGQPASITGGYNGGGNGESGGRGGGGATDLRRGATLADRFLVAGGGGGGGFWAGVNLEIVGGVGGDLTGGSGYRVPDYASNPGGQGATQSASGTGTCVSYDNPAMSGGLGFGGAPAGCGCQGYGGGGGYYGGAGSGNCRGGGGGSGFAAAVGVANVVHTAGGASPGNGRIHIDAK
ncbi:MAG: hypothetical protein JWP87_1597 [Labilithrix sp.]|nr:hypothetical protein [Labilithrix sp.]